MTVPHKVFYLEYHTHLRLDIIKDNICYYRDERNNSIYVLDKKDAHLPQVMQRMLEPYLKANDKNTNVYVLTDSELAISNYHSLLIEYQNYPERFDYFRKDLIASHQKTLIVESDFDKEEDLYEDLDEIEK